MRLDWYVPSLLYAPMLCGMMAEEGPIPIAGDHISFDDLHAEIISLLLKEEYGASFRTDRHTYRMNNDRTILALQGARSTLKIFEYNNDLATLSAGYYVDRMPDYRRQSSFCSTSARISFSGH